MLIPRGLIVSCQAEAGSPFNSPMFIAAFAQAAESGGAVAVRIRGAENVREVKRVCTIPIIGITKGAYASGEVLITPGLEDVESLAGSGADVVALDATRRVRPNGKDGIEMLRAVRERFSFPLIADVSTLDEGLAAAEAGADLVATTLSGYTDPTRTLPQDVPDLALVGQLAARLPGRVIAEGRIWTPEQASSALRHGAHAVVVGTAITRPVEVVRRFSEAVQTSITGEA